MNIDVPHNRATGAKSSPRIPTLDGLRGMAILLVLVWHYGVTSIKLETGSTALHVIVRGLLLTWSGVDLFFVLSGFLIGGILLDNKEASGYFRTFYIRRICRIIPLYFLWLLLFVAFSLAAPVLIPATSPLAELFEKPLPLWSYASFTQNIAMAQSGTFGPRWLGITWSLAIEEQFYILLPLIIRFVTNRRLPHVLVCFIVAAPLLRTLLFRFHPQSGFAASVLTPCKADALLLGVLCAYLMRQERIAHYITGHTRHLYGVFAVLLAGTTVLILITPSPSAVSPAMISFGYSWLALLYACLLLIAITEKRGIVTSVMKAPLLRNLGGIAYGVYLFHQTFNSLSHGLILQQSPQIQTELDVLVTLGALLLTVATAYISWTFFEKRIVALGHSFTYKLK